ncbi:MAG: PspC domain-containing protein [Thermodesulfobacteriota bacterium]
MKKIYRSRKNKMIAGICGAASEMLNIDPTLIRLAVIFITLITGLLPIIITYIIGCVIIPYKDKIISD